MQTGNFCCPLFLILLLAVSTIVLGFIFVFRKDSAWQISEWALRTVKPQRTRAWERDSTFRGVLLLVFGVFWLSLIFYWLLK